MNHLIIGICAHVDAGKTTLSEGILYLGGSIRKMGRVDNRDAFLDTDEMERARGITIFSKQAQFERTLADGTERIYTLLDTPGHADFSPEMERTLQVLDLAVLVISAADGVNAQVRMLWSLLEHYGVPTVIFVNKMDQMEAIGEGESRRAEVFAEIQESSAETQLILTGSRTRTAVPVNFQRRAGVRSTQKAPRQEAVRTVLQSTRTPRNPSRSVTRSSSTPTWTAGKSPGAISES